MSRTPALRSDALLLLAAMVIALGLRAGTSSAGQPSDARLHQVTPGLCPSRSAVHDLGLHTEIFAIAANDQVMVTADEYGLTTWDTRDLTHPEPVGVLATASGERTWTANKVVLDQRGFAYLKYGIPVWGGNPTDQDVVVVDLRAQVPTLVRSIKLATGEAIDIDVDGSTLVVAGLYLPTVTLYDVSAPEAPRLLATVRTPEEHPPIAVDLDGGRLTIVHEGGIDLHDVSDPASPQPLGSLSTELGALTSTRAWIFGDTVVVSAGSSYAPPLTFVFDVSDPTGPQQVADALPDGIRVMTQVGDRLFAATGGSTPGEVFELGRDDAAQLVATNAAPTGVPRGMAGLGDTLWVSDTYTGGGLSVYDIATGIVAVGEPAPTASADTIVVADDVAVLPLASAGIRVVDLGSTSGLEAATDLDVGFAADVAVCGEHAFVVGDNHFTVVDVASPLDARMLAQLALLDQVNSVTCRDNLVMMTSGRYYLPLVWFVDVSEPTHPVVLSTMDIGYGGGALALLPGVAYFASGAFVDVFDISVGDYPQRMPSARVPFSCGGITALHVAGTTALALCTSAPSFWLDLSDPLAPQVVGEVPVQGTGLAVGGASLVIADGWSTHFVDLQDSTAPVIRSLDMQRSARGVALHRDRALVVAHPFVEILAADCSAPAASFTWRGAGPEAWFEDTSSGWVAERVWDFGDGQQSTALAPHHVYAHDGVYRVTLTVTGEGSSSTSRELATVPPRIRQPGGRTRP